MLTLVGMGLWSLGDVPLKAYWELRKCDEVYAEQYTSFMQPGILSQLQAKIGVSRISILSRTEVEDGKKLLEKAKTKRIALIIAGDPLIATTHVSLLLDAKKKGIKTQVIHAASIYTAAAGEAGLQIYKFGKTVTLAKWREKYEPMSTYDVIEENLKRGLHTLLLIDIDEGHPLEQAEIFEIIRKMEEKAGRKVLDAKRKIVVLSRVGSGEQKVIWGSIGELEKGKLGKPPFVLIVPGELHFAEKDYLESL